MRVIDDIRSSIDNDLLKYQSFTLCEIEECMPAKLMGLLLRVRPVGAIGSHVTMEDKDTGEFKNSPITAVCINFSFQNFSNIKDKYYALVINVLKDSMTNPIAFLIPKTLIDPFDKRLPRAERYKLIPTKKELLEEMK